MCHTGRPACPSPGPEKVTQDAPSTEAPIADVLMAKGVAGGDLRKGGWTLDWQWHTQPSGLSLSAITARAGDNGGGTSDQPWFKEPNAFLK